MHYIKSHPPVSIFTLNSKLIKVEVLIECFDLPGVGGG